MKLGKITTEETARRTRYSERRGAEFIEQARKIESDPQATLRHAALECAPCYYTPRVAGQGFTRFNCQNCGTEDLHGNTAVPAYCKGCASEHRVCRRCGASLAEGRDHP